MAHSLEIYRHSLGCAHNRCRLFNYRSIGCSSLTQFVICDRKEFRNISINRHIYMTCFCHILCLTDNYFLFKSDITYRLNCLEIKTALQRSRHLIYALVTGICCTYDVESGTGKYKSIVAKFGYIKYLVAHYRNETVLYFGRSSCDFLKTCEYSMFHADKKRRRDKCFTARPF